MGLVRRIARALLLAVVGFLLLSILVVVVYGLINPPITPLMVIRLIEGEGLRRDSVSYMEISPNLVRAVISSEDARFCHHFGVDWDAVESAWDRNLRGGRVYGGSTITMQTAKNLFLWPDRNWVRKGFELWFTLLLEAFLDKQRIIELYLNVVEWGGGIYGAEAAARTYFGKSAASLSAREAALMAAVLPNPRRWSPAKPTAYIAGRAGTIQARMRVLPEDVTRLCRS
jgi:monofunctional biosynthetic peptidoglycan transglycosylase